MSLIYTPEEEAFRAEVRTFLQNEYLPEKGAPIYQALLPATSEGRWVEYLWKGAKKHTYVRRTNTNLTVGSGN